MDAAWGRWVRPWALAAWSFLTLGIALGSWWAYYELGWGGYWFWDPVENASLHALAGRLALLHSAIVVEKREALKTWTVFLACSPFGMSLLGTFLVRSGVLNSVHAFANDPERGVFILACWHLHRRRLPAVRLAGPGVAADRRLRAGVARGRAGAEQPAALLDRRGGAGRHAVSDVRRPDARGRRSRSGRPSSTPPPAAGGAADRRHGLRADAALETRAAVPGAAAAVVGGAGRARRAGAGLALEGTRIGPALGFARGALDHRGRSPISPTASRCSAGRRRPGPCPRPAARRLGGAIAHGGMGVMILGLAGMGLATDTLALLKPGEATTLAGLEYRLVGVARAGPNYPRPPRDRRGAGRSRLVTRGAGEPAASRSPA